MALTRDQLRRIPTTRKALAPLLGPVEIVRADAELGTVGPAEGVLHGYFARFGEWNEINSMYEGRFLERVDSAAFNRTLQGRGANASVLFNHGHDPTMGEQVLGTVTVLEARDAGPYYEVELFDSVPALLADGLRAGEYGASYRFRVRDDEWTDPTTPSDHNPERLPERTIREVELFEFGPVTFPADPFATASLRDYDFVDDETLADIEDLRTAPATGTALANTPADGSPPGTPTRITRHQALLDLINL